MKFLSLIRVKETGQQPSQRLMDEMGKLMEQQFRARKLVRTAGLKPSAEGIRLRSNYGKFSRTDGPFAETKEVIGGYAVLEADSKEEAIELTRAFLKVHGDEWDLECELRELASPEFCPGQGLS